MRRANQLRWIWLIVVVWLATALVGGAYINARGITAAVSTLNRGQADVIGFALRDAFRPEAGPVSDSALQRFLESHHATGVRYIAIVDTGGRVIYSAGTPSAPVERPPRPIRSLAPDRSLLSIRGRIRAFYPRPPIGWRPDSLAAVGNLMRFPPILAIQVTEFEPVAAGLVANARRSLITSLISAAILIVATFIFWRTSRRYESARQRLEEQHRLTLLGEMSAVLAHEIRNPLASLKGHAQLLTERLVQDTPEHAKAWRVVNEAQRLELLTNDLLDFARAGPMDLNWVDPAELLRAHAAAFANINVDATDAPMRWRLDERRFGHGVLTNLLQNAAQAAPTGCPVEARVFLEKGSLVFTIRDYGAGIHEEQASRLFDPFFTTRTTGTGLGLAVARRIVEMHGGRITAENFKDGNGAVFRVELPPRS